MKNAIVTGGASGIGLAIATRFVKEGINTIIIGRDIEKLTQTKKELGSLCHPLSFDLNELKHIPTMVQKIIENHGHIDILVNNAGINHKMNFEEVSDDDFDRILQLNLKSVFSISREVAKDMLTQKKGSIVHIASMASQYGIPKVISYTASKSAIEGMTRAMSTELSPKGIRTNCVAPGFIATDMSAAALNNDPERKNKVMGRTPMGYLGEPADVAEAVYFLASDAAKYITGVILPVDGGNSVGF